MADLDREMLLTQTNLHKPARFNRILVEFTYLRSN